MSGYVRTTAYWKIHHLKKKIKVIQGGQGASKTYSILILFLEYCITEPGTKCTVVTESYPQLNDGVIADMEHIIKSAGLSWDKMFNKSTKNLAFTNGSLIQFRNIDNKDFHKAKGARRDYLFINEANRVMWGSLEQLWTRTSKGIFVDFNPDREFWYHEKKKDGSIGEHDFLILTYNDNEMLDDGERKEIELRKSNVLWWQIYGLGQLGVYSDRQIYQYEFIDKIPDTAKRIPSGMDFGFNPDPTTLIDLWIDGVNVYADEVFTMNNLEPVKIPGMEAMAIVDKLDEVVDEKGRMIIADSSGGRSITDIQNNGYNVYAVKKDKLVMDGIKELRSYNLFITKRSTGIKKGCESWHFDIDDNNKIIPAVPKAHEPDQLAAIRYVIIMKDRLWF